MFDDRRDGAQHQFVAPHTLEVRGGVEGPDREVPPDPRRQVAAQLSRPGTTQHGQPADR